MHVYLFILFQFVFADGKFENLTKGCNSINLTTPTMDNVCLK